MKKIADYTFKFHENGGNLQAGRKHCGKRREKLLITSNFSLFHCIFKRLQTHTNQGLFLKGQFLGTAFLNMQNMYQVISM